MKVTLNISDNDAETILFALALRSKQAKLSPSRAEDARGLGEYLNLEFTKQMDWTDFDRMAHMRHPIKRVSVTFYDYPPNDPPKI
jgi:hypothetical protein